MAAIEVLGLRKRYGAAEVLRGLDFQVAAGEVFCILGPNGAGKTTTMEILQGFRSRTSGDVRVLGADPQRQSAVIRHRAGIVLQQCALPGDLRVRELVDSYRSCYPTPLPTGQLLAVVELEAQAHRLIRELSGGQQRRVDLALALAGDPDLIFLDEPTTGFDPGARRRTWAAIHNLTGLGKTVLLTTHYLEEAQELADRVAVITQGRVVACETPGRLAGRHLAASRISYELSAADTDPPPLVADTTYERTGTRVTMTTRDSQAQLTALLSWARRGGRNLLGLAVNPPTLEDAYLDLVGRNESPSQ